MNNTIHSSAYWTEFPDFGALHPAISAMRESGALRDISYSNDACPSFVRACDYAKVEADGSADGVRVLFVNYPDVAKRCEFTPSFLVQCITDDFALETESLAEAINALLGDQTAQG